MLRLLVVTFYSCLLEADMIISIDIQWPESAKLALFRSHFLSLWLCEKKNQAVNGKAIVLLFLINSLNGTMAVFRHSLWYQIPWNDSNWKNFENKCTFHHRCVFNFYISLRSLQGLVGSVSLFYTSGFRFQLLYSSPVLWCLGSQSHRKMKKWLLLLLFLLLVHKYFYLY